MKHSSRLWLAAAVGVGAVLIALLRRFPPQGILPLTALAAAPVLLVWLVRRSPRETALWAGYIALFIVFAQLRGMADELFPARFVYVIALEWILFGGVLPTGWLQAQLFSGVPGWFDWTMAGVHLSYFIIPHALGLFIWAYRPERLARYLVAMIGVYYAALVIQALVPTAPPWLASVQGFGDFKRVMEIIATQQVSESASAFAFIADSNPVAAMPSLHTAVTVVVALAAGESGRATGWLGWLYVGAMAFALVYLGEHYVVDAVAGAVLAGFIWLATAGLMAEAKRETDAVGAPLSHHGTS